jgi:polysaccharide deacetylase 2 family uncharacterized protein YibQ
MARRSRTGFRLAVLSLLLISTGLLTVLVACPPSAKRQAEPSSQPRAGGEPEPTRPPAGEPAAPQPEVKGRMAVIIDDAGYDLAELEPFLELRIPLAVAVLPNLPNSREAARRVRQAGKELLLHLPMEPEGGENPGPGALLTGQDEAETRRLLAAALETVPGASGLNNHMGSKATADEELMTTVLRALGEKGMFFVDSRTTPDTVGARVAARLGVPYLERDVFIDAAHSDGEIAEAFASGIALAARQGTAVLIGHVQNGGVLAILRASDRALREAGVKLSTLSDVLDRQGRGPIR